MTLEPRSVFVLDPPLWLVCRPSNIFYFVILKFSSTLSSTDYVYINNPNIVSLGCPLQAYKVQTHEKIIPGEGKKKLYQTVFSKNGHALGYYSDIVVSPDLKLGRPTFKLFDKIMSFTYFTWCLPFSANG